MRYALISDIHGNLEALKAVLEAISKENIRKFLCIGDIVGYGADPKECIKTVKSLEPEAVVAGNHEWGVLGLLDMEYFNEHAAQAIMWTKSILDKEEEDYLRSFKLVYKDKQITLVHGTLDSPESFYYTMINDDAYTSMKAMETPVCFVGHSHVPGIFYSEDGSAAHTYGPEAKIEPNKKYVINIGSVGQPRDGDPRASFAIFDDEEYSVTIKRAKYDIDTAQKKILRSGLPEILAHRLALGR